MPPSVQRSDAVPIFSRRDQVEQCLANISDPAGEGTRTFLTVWDEDARVAADSLDGLDRAGYHSVLDGLPVSIKDLLDVKGEVTRAAAPALDDAPPARDDAPVVTRLRQAGAILLGRTNMTPFAYSVVGLNSHFGTPGNPADRTRTPGGSSSGAAVSVASGMAAAAIGSDTVGSIRVPAALCGVVGVKPTQRTVPLEGAFPLSTTLDSIGPLARSVEDCARVLATISGRRLQRWQRTHVDGLRLALPGGRFLEGLDITVAGAFERACRRLSAAGARIRDQTFEPLDRTAGGGLARVIQSAEAYATHEALLARRGGDYDRRIRARVLQGREVTAADYVHAIRTRSELVAAFTADMAEVDALILPTVPVVAPSFAECEADEDGVRTRLLRNTAPFNLLDACAITLPIQAPGELPVGLMLAAPSGHDTRLIDLAHAIEAVLRY
jgi:aspartyl-tRNA(Asn)/glutamyl-tRNA(Gln) amidotransferase subunit A